MVMINGRASMWMCTQCWQIPEVAPHDCIGEGGPKHNFISTRPEHIECESGGCAACDWTRETLPEWVTYGSVFGLDGRVYRVIAIGSTNRHAPGNAHFDPHVTCEEVTTADPWSLPPPGTRISDFAARVADFRRLPRFYATDLRRAVRLVKEAATR